MDEHERSAVIDQLDLALREWPRLPTATHRFNPTALLIALAQCSGTDGTMTLTVAAILDMADNLEDLMRVVKGDEFNTLRLFTALCQYLAFMHADSILASLKEEVARIKSTGSTLGTEHIGVVIGGQLSEHRDVVIERQQANRYGKTCPLGFWRSTLTPPDELRKAQRALEKAGDTIPPMSPDLTVEADQQWSIVIRYYRLVLRRSLKDIMTDKAMNVLARHPSVYALEAALNVPMPTAWQQWLDSGRGGREWLEAQQQESTPMATDAVDHPTAIADVASPFRRSSLLVVAVEPSSPTPKETAQPPEPQPAPSSSSRAPRRPMARRSQREVPQEPASVEQDEQSQDDDRPLDDATEPCVILPDDESMTMRELLRRRAINAYWLCTDRPERQIEQRLDMPKGTIETMVLSGELQDREEFWTPWIERLGQDTVDRFKSIYYELAVTNEDLSAIAENHFRGDIERLKGFVQRCGIEPPRIEPPVLPLVRWSQRQDRDTEYQDHSAKIIEGLYFWRDSVSMICDAVGITEDEFPGACDNYWILSTPQYDALVERLRQGGAKLTVELLSRAMELQFGVIKYCDDLDNLVEMLGFDSREALDHQCRELCVEILDQEEGEASIPSHEPDAAPPARSVDDSLVEDALDDILGDGAGGDEIGDRSAPRGRVRREGTRK